MIILLFCQNIKVKIKLFFLMKKVLPCILSKPCQNGATCIDDNIGGYKCTCPTGYTGKNCQYGMIFIIMNIPLKKSSNIKHYYC